MSLTSDVKVFSNVNELYAKVAQAFIRKITELSKQRSRIQLGVSGGSIATKLFPMVSQFLEAHPEVIDNWVPIHIWLVDERHVPITSAERTSTLVRKYLTDQYPIFTLHDVLPPDTCADPVAAARAYEQELKEVFSPAQGSLDALSKKAQTVRLDFALLGMGPDGHFASLFPSHESLQAAGLVTAELDSPKPPAIRVTMTLELLRRTQVSWFVVTGSDKALALAHAIHGADYREVPASAMNQVGTIWWCDAAAAVRVNPLG
ncbi:6-phosphogluconolactonase [Gleimia sp. 6138-11-ORH1]|uniref:6-phosphogluconolactonase n=1 Tax=Gleimia sp. 6138-11-ORH1 TaxID=2973937 RepID=UPI002167C64C|nr:6-phosphogluconolactonase [Gleimia sp. 6138-11-ORH1]MCS4484327.1 6-phosphogluconolactonase [Gleimia sp. 6138-11-ORH1]